MTRHSSSPDGRPGTLLTEEALSPEARFRDLMACWPTGVAVVTGAADGHPFGCTVTALASVTTSPPLLLVSLATTSRTLRAIERSSLFGVCVLATRDRRLTGTFAGGDPLSRFTGVGFDWVLGTPVLRGAVTAAVCAVHSRLTVTDHVLVTGEPLWQAQDPAGDPVIRFRRGLWRLVPADVPP